MCHNLKDRKNDLVANLLVIDKKYDTVNGQQIIGNKQLMGFQHYIEINMQIISK